MGITEEECMKEIVKMLHLECVSIWSRILDIERKGVRRLEAHTDTHSHNSITEN